MIQISYQPSFDPFHTAYRLFRLRDQFESAALDHVRIVDFYLLFPFRLGEVRFRKADQRFKRLGAAYASRRGYAIQPPALELFNSMKPVFEAAVQTLAGQGYFDEQEFRGSALTVTDKPAPPAIEERASRDNEQEADLIECLDALLDYDFLGVDGVKARTGLMEFRNDAA